MVRPGSRGKAICMVIKTALLHDEVQQAPKQRLTVARYCTSATEVVPGRLPNVAAP